MISLSAASYPSHRKKVYNSAIIYGPPFVVLPHFIYCMCVCVLLGDIIENDVAGQSESKLSKRPTANVALLTVWTVPVKVAAVAAE